MKKDLKKASLPTFDSEPILGKLDECNALYELMSNMLKKPATNIYSTLNSYMPAAVSMLYDIHDFIDFCEPKIDKDELFLRYLPQDFKKSTWSMKQEVWLMKQPI